MNVVPIRSSRTRSVAKLPLDLKLVTIDETLRLRWERIVLEVRA